MLLYHLAELVLGGEDVLNVQHVVEPIELRAVTALATKSVAGGDQTYIGLGKVDRVQRPVPLQMGPPAFHKLKLILWLQLASYACRLHAEDLVTSISGHPWWTGGYQHWNPTSVLEPLPWRHKIRIGILVDCQVLG